MKNTYIIFTFAALFIVFYSSGQNVQTETLTDSAFSRQAKQETLTGIDVNRQKISDTVYKQKGYVNFTQVGIGLRLGLPVYSISTVNGYQFSPHLSLGFGVGFIRTQYPLWGWRSYKTGSVTKSKYSVSVNQITFFISERFFIGHASTSPFFMYDFGYAFNLSPNDHELTSTEIFEWRSAHQSSDYISLVKTSYDGGLFFAPGFGFKTFMSKTLSLNFSFQLYFAMYSRNETDRMDTGEEYYTKGDKKLNLYPLLNIGLGF
ncbi:MAG: hypothetical protein NT004_02450 [Bacteroidetes bacterium]|nr:hypothetical protein [Bacteroidota bacterium]